MTATALFAMPFLTEQVIRIGSSLSESDWNRPTGCPGWTVHDIFTHLTCTFRDITNTPGFPTPVSGSIERTNDVAVAAFRGLTPQQNLDAYRGLVEQAMTVLEARQSAEQADRLIDLDDAGVYPLHLMADSLVFDHYCHLKHDLNVRGSLDIDIEADAPTMTSSLTWLMAGLPQMSPARLAPTLRAPVALELSGVGGARWVMSCDDGVTVTQDGSDVSAVIACSGDEFMLWGTGRIDWRTADIRFEGDEDLGRAVADAIRVF